MTESPGQQRYRQDALVLARIGQCLTKQLEPVTVRLPAELAVQAAQAWAREEKEPTGPETAEQALMRSFAATLALVGLRVGEESATDEVDVVVTLTVQQVAGCVFAAEYVEGRGVYPDGLHDSQISAAMRTRSAR